MLEHRIFLTSGFGNNLFQIVEFSDVENCKVIDILQTQNLLTRLIGFKVFHGYNPKFEPLQYHQCNLLDIAMLGLLYLRWFFSKVDHVEIRVGNTVWHFGYYQNNYTFKDDHRRYLRALCKLEDQEPLDRVACIHVRRGDFDEQSLNIDYYAAALKYMYDENHIHKFHLVGIGAADLERELSDACVTGYDIEIKPLSDERSDFDLIRKYVYQICSNSTFNFWAVVLGNAKFAVFPNALSVNLRNARKMNLRLDDVRFF